MSDGLAGVPDREPRPAPPARGAPRARVLVADDDAEMRSYLTLLLAPHYEVETVADGAAALAAARTRPPDLVLADVMMPALDGLALARAWRAKPALERVPLILLSARAGETSRIEGIEAGADDYLEKPFTDNELLARIGARLELARLRHDAEASMREREERLRAVIETTPECVKLVRADGTLVQMNPSGLAMIGAARAEDMVGRSVYDLVVPEHREMYRAFNERICRGEKGTLEFEMIGAGGVRRHMDTHAAPLAMPDGTTVQLALTRDITARRTAEATVREADRRKDEFIATLSHELRNPLAPLRNALALLRNGGGPAPAMVAALHEMMERQVDHLVRLVDDLLEMSRISRGILELRRARVELGSVVRNAVETSEPLIREAGHRLEVQLPPGPVWLEGDPVRLAQIFANLLNNAARFTPGGGRITIVAEARAGEARVAVRDTGRGFVPETAASLFEMFSKSDRSSGLGIGLALARRLAELHGGTISGHSDGESRGAEFVVRLPIAEGEARPTSAPPDRMPVTVARRVLVADDNRDSAESLAYLLRSLGNEVHLAFDGSEAVEAARAFRPDLALLDIGMPKLNGYEAAQRIRVEAGARPLKLVALTGWGQDDAGRRAREAGFDEHIVKPAEIATLRALLERSA